MKIKIQIDELVLNGFTTHNRYRIAEAIESELTRLVNERNFSSLLTGNRETPFVKGGHFEMNQGTSEKSVGVRIAEAVYSGMSHQQTNEKNE